MPPARLLLTPVSFEGACEGSLVHYLIQRKAAGKTGGHHSITDIGCAMKVEVRDFFGSKLGWLFTLTAAMLGAYLLWNHTGHVLGALPYVILLLCPLMHLFGHRHGHQREHRHD
jgi:hypothetical protein